MKIVDLTKEQAEIVVKWLEDRAFTQIIAPLMADEQESKVRSALAAIRSGNVAEAQYLGGYSEGISYIAELHDVVMQIIQAPE